MTTRCLSPLDCITRSALIAAVLGYLSAGVGAALAQLPDRPSRADVLRELQTLRLELDKPPTSTVSGGARLNRSRNAARSSLGRALLEAGEIDETFGPIDHDPTLRVLIALRRGGPVGIAAAAALIEAETNFQAKSKARDAAIDHLIERGQPDDATALALTFLIPESRTRSRAISHVLRRALALGRNDFAAMLLARHTDKSARDADLLVLAMDLAAAGDVVAARSHVEQIDGGDVRREAMLQVAAVSVDRGTYQPALDLISRVEADRYVWGDLMDWPAAEWPAPKWYARSGGRPFEPSARVRLRGEGTRLYGPDRDRDMAPAACRYTQGTGFGYSFEYAVPDPLIGALAMMMIRAGETERARPYVVRLERYLLTELATASIDDLPYIPPPRRGFDPLEGVNREVKAPTRAEIDQRHRQTIAACWITRAIQLRLALGDNDRLPALLRAMPDGDQFLDTVSLAAGWLTLRGQSVLATELLDAAWVRQAKLGGLQGGVADQSRPDRQRSRIFEAYDAGRLDELTAEIERAACRADALRPIFTLVVHELAGRHAEEARAVLAAIEALEGRRPDLVSLRWLVVIGHLHLDDGAGANAARILARLLERGHPIHPPRGIPPVFSYQCADEVSWLDTYETARFFARMAPVTGLVAWFEQDAVRQDPGPAPWLDDIARYAASLAIFDDVDTALPVLELALRLGWDKRRQYPEVLDWRPETPLATALAGAGRLSESWRLIDGFATSYDAIDLKARASLAFLTGRNLGARHPAHPPHRVSLP